MTENNLPQSSLPYTKGVRISPDGSKAVFLTRDDFTKFGIIKSISRAQGVIINWPSGYEEDYYLRNKLILKVIYT